MKLTILGCGSALPRPGGACSGYLVEEGETRVLLDCGNGVVSNLMKVVDLRAVNAIVVSHWHADHWFDLVPYRYGIQLSSRPVIVKPQLYLPPGGTAALEGTTVVFHPAGHFFSSVFSVAEYDPNQELSVGALRMSFARTQHVLPTWAIRVHNGQQSLVYSSDTGPCESVEQLARGTSLLLCEATLQGPGDTSSTALHMSATQAGQLAARAGVGMLVLTHIWPELDVEESRREALQFFPDVRIAKEMDSYVVA